MKKTVLALLLISFLLLPAIGLAATTPPVVVPPAVRPAPEIPFLGALDRIVDVLFTILMAVAVISVMIGAFQLLTAGGDAEAINKGREKILYALIAVVVALLAQGMVTFVEHMFPGHPVRPVR